MCLRIIKLHHLLHVLRYVKFSYEKTSKTSATRWIVLSSRVVDEYNIARNPR